MTEVIHIGDRRELFIDTCLIERMEQVSLRLHEPASGGPVVGIDRAWEGPANGPSAVFHHDGRYLLYYRGMTLAPDQQSGVLCVATSDDGVTWTKPALGLVDTGGDRDTNIVADSDGQPLMIVPWLDTRPGVPDDERIKALHSEPISGEEHTAFKDPAGPKRLVLWSSADGFTFRRCSPQPEIVSSLLNCFDGGNTMFWSEAEQQYVLYYRWYEGEWGTGPGRSMARTTSADFLHWTDPEPMTYGDTPREQFYTNSTQPYYRAPHIYIAPAARFMEGRGVLSDAQVEAIGLQTSQGHYYGGDCSDAVLLTSRAGTTQYDRTFMEAFIRPGPDPSNWVSRTNYPVTGILPYGPQQMMLFVARHYMQDSWHIERLLLRTDGFASLNAPWAGGEAITKVMTFTGSQLELNYRTSAAGSVRVEIQDGDGTPIPGYGIDDCIEIIGDEVERVVVWAHGSSVADLAGRSVRLRLHLKDADLFSFRFQKDNA
jgi:hypothetical protein